MDQQLSREKTDSGENGSSHVDEQRKLVFGMMYSLGELIGKLTPHDENPCEYLVTILCSYYSVYRLQNRRE